MLLCDHKKPAPSFSHAVLYEPLQFDLSGDKMAPWINAIRITPTEHVADYSRSFVVTGVEVFGRLQRARTFNMAALRSATTPTKAA